MRSTRSPATVRDINGKGSTSAATLPEWTPRSENRKGSRIPHQDDAISRAEKPEQDAGDI
jgi:hypothetical protein